MLRGKTSILTSALAMGVLMAWSIAGVSPAFAQRGGGRGGSGSGGGFRGGSPPGSGAALGGGGRIHGGYAHGGYSRGAHAGSSSASAYYGGGSRHSHVYRGPYGRGYGDFGPSFSIHVGAPFYPYYDYYAYYSTPYFPTPYFPTPYFPTPHFNSYVLPYVAQYGALGLTRPAPPAFDNGAVIPAAGKAAEFQLQAEQAFRERRYEDAARLNSHAIVEDSRNGKLHLFAAQALFALSDFQSAAAAIRQAAALLDRSEWGFVVENYQKFYSGDDYVTQTARLVEFIKENPDASYARFLLGYHYKFLGYDEAARAPLAKAVELESRDRLAAELLTMAGGKARGAPELAAPQLPPSEELVIPGPAPKPTLAAPSDEKR